MLVLKKVSLFLTIFFFISQMQIWAQEVNSFSLVDENEISTIVIDDSEAEVVKIAGNLLKNDIKNISGKIPNLGNSLEENIVLAGTLGKSKWINQLVYSNKIDVSDIEGKWETYKILVVENPFDEVKKALVIIGSDRRATAYGLLEISRKIGVSPWEWWADVVPEKMQNIQLNIASETFGEPSVKYRGIFLNDEDWGLQPWAANTFEPETNDIGPKTYAKVFELLLRLRANTIWPAMHSSTKAFYHYPENKKVADDYAIVVGSSHAEPMLSNINAEWDHETMGDYRYDTNASSIKKFFEKRTKATANYEGIYTLGMRGEHDSPMIVGNEDVTSQVSLLENVINDQREILKKYKADYPNTPQAFVPYKEVLHYYKNGLKVPDDVTLIWTDDNYGYIRQLSTESEQNRKGGSGVYYHTSYWGRPHDYLWLNSTNPVLMWEELHKAYSLNASEMWILNSGDIKPHEYNIELFMDMGWDISAFKKSEEVESHQLSWAKREFGKEFSSAISDIMNSYYHLAFQRKPEFMAWSQVEPVTKNKETQLSSIHYGDEVTTRINQYQQLVASVDSIKNQITNNRKDAFYELVYYPVKAAAALNKMWLYAYKNKFVATQNRESAKYYAQKSAEAYEAVAQMTSYYNDSIQNAKWKYIMNKSPRNLPVFDQPAYMGVNSSQESGIGLSLEGHEMEYNQNTTNAHSDVLPIFNAYTENSYYIDVFLKGKEAQNWSTKTNVPWLKLSKTEGKLSTENPEDRIIVSIDWDLVPKGEDKKEAPLGHDYQLIPPSFKVNTTLDILANSEKKTVGVSVFNPELKELKEYNGFIEDKGFVVINAENPTKNKKGTETFWEPIQNLGYTGKVMQAKPYKAAPIAINDSVLKNSAILSYDFYTFNYGEVAIRLASLPTHPLNENYGVRCAVAIDDNSPEIIDFETQGRSEEWKENVLRNRTIKSMSSILNKPGKHTIKIYIIDPGLMIDQILIDLGGLKNAYAFPAETKSK
ncbi:glycosyl hydrolase 115 family protein [Zunongwangia sp. HRR-M8]|uniref:glycosyl hydrolase 115 family protein n=1 Tax=Zunongwangia sp. HRR-M8 TaxID=3015170 RepID=UPI0022DD7A1B|nr:glycosyl hydrolase 115 family protein [Zunongwangia sp. HRR-M8]WBL21641.1 glycosyl hydrolase 115 family protein [Zunongwangia sp. HRR-M8]